MAQAHQSHTPEDIKKNHTRNTVIGFLVAPYGAEIKLEKELRINL